MKRLISCVLLVALLLLSMAGCAADVPAETEPIQTEPVVTEPQFDPEITETARLSTLWRAGLDFECELEDITYDSVEEEDGIVTVNGKADLVDQAGTTYSIEYVVTMEPDDSEDGDYRVITWTSNFDEVYAEMQPSPWEVAYYVDEFGDFTKDKYLRGVFEGYFSNSATMDSDLEVYVNYDDNFDFHLIEYGTHRATFRYDEVSIKIKVDDMVTAGELINMASAGYVFTSNSGEINKVLYKAMVDGETVQVVIAEGSSKYRFDINGKGFADLLNQA